MKCAYETVPNFSVKNILEKLPSVHIILKDQIRSNLK